MAVENIPQQMPPSFQVNLLTWKLIFGNMVFIFDTMFVTELEQLFRMFFSIIVIDLDFLKISKI